MQKILSQAYGGYFKDKIFEHNADIGQIGPLQIDTNKK